MVCGVAETPVKEWQKVAETPSVSLEGKQMIGLTEKLV